LLLHQNLLLVPEPTNEPSSSSRNQVRPQLACYTSRHYFLEILLSSPFLPCSSSSSSGTTGIGSSGWWQAAPSIWKLSSFRHSRLRQARRRRQQQQIAIRAEKREEESSFLPSFFLPLSCTFILWHGSLDGRPVTTAQLLGQWMGRVRERASKRVCVRERGS
jgi:hypothetical protein